MVAFCSWPTSAASGWCVFRVDATSGLVFDGTITSENFAGPRHLCFDAEGKTLYVASQGAKAVTVFRYHPQDGTATEIDHEPTLPASMNEINNHIAEIEVHPSGKFVYVSNRGTFNSIAVQQRDPKTGELTFVEAVESGGVAPWSFTIHPNGKFLYAANRSDGTIVTFAIDPQTGRLKRVGEPVLVPMPKCLSFARP